MKRDQANRRAFLLGGAAGAQILLPTLVAAAASHTSGQAGTVVIETASGKVRGQVRPGVASFLGLPFGASTAGPVRFMPPSAAEPWVGVRDCFEFGPKAPQPATTAPPELEAYVSHEAMSEDCLSVNVWTPAVGGHGKRPVMVWLHGGGFWQNSGSCEVWRGQDLAAKHDVVVVSPNHRLNAFGYLYFGDNGTGRYAKSNNLGLQDLVAALEWVRGNIAAFGGDPGNVTIFGESGGGRKVSALLAMPAAKGLFQRAIIQSGPLNEMMSRDTAAQATATLMAKLGLGSGDFDRLQSLPAEQIVAAMGGLQALLIPAADGQVLPREPNAVMAPGISASVPLIIGCNGTESTLFDLPPEALSDAEFHARTKSKLRLDDTSIGRLMEAYRRTHGSNIEACIALESDYSYRMATILKAERRTVQGPGPTYVYWFTWRTPVRGGRMRSPHAVELPFVFDHADVGKALIGTGPDLQQLATAISSSWAAFARTGNPNHGGLPHWPVYEVRKRQTMIFDKRCSVVNDPGREDRLAFQASGGAPFSGVPTATPARMPGPAEENK